MYLLIWIKENMLYYLSYENFEEKECLCEYMYMYRKLLVLCNICILINIGICILNR